MSARLPFEGVTVIELGTVIAGPFAGSLMADLGAEVIKIESPQAPDALRRMGLWDDGSSLWWGVASRDKRCVSLDLKSEAGKDLFRGLLERADVLIENFRPGVLDRLGFGWPALQAINPGLVLLSISGFGQTGTDSRRPGFGKIAEGLSGMVGLTGEPGTRPLFVGFSLADTCAGLFGTYGIAVALYQRDINGGRGAQIDLALYEPLLRMLDCQLALHAERQVPPGRRGTSDPRGWGADAAGPGGFASLAASTGEWFFVHIPDPAVLDRLVGDRDPAVAWKPALLAWAAGLAPAALRDRLLQAGAAIVPVLDGLSAARNEYLLARGDVRPAQHPRAGDIAVPGPVGGAEGRLTGARTSATARSGPQRWASTITTFSGGISGSTGPRSTR